MEQRSHNLLACLRHHQFSPCRSPCGLVDGAVCSRQTPSREEKDLTMPKSLGSEDVLKPIVIARLCPVALSCKIPERPLGRTGMKGIKSLYTNKIGWVYTRFDLISYPGRYFCELGVRCLAVNRQIVFF